jgi:hypothetical protein
MAACQSGAPLIAVPEPDSAFQPILPSLNVRWLIRSDRHLPAGFGTGPAHRDAFVHSTDPRTILRAFCTYLGAFATHMFMMRRVDEHEMSRCPAYLGASHHQTEMSRLHMLPTAYETMVHRGAEARLVAGKASLDATAHLLGKCHIYLKLLDIHCTSFTRSGRST